MEKIEITLSFDEEKLRALEFCLKKEKATVKGKMTEALAQLYEQTVPVPLREYLDSQAALAHPKRPTRPAPKEHTAPSGQDKEGGA